MYLIYIQLEFLGLRYRRQEIHKLDRFPHESMRLLLLLLKSGQWTSALAGVVHRRDCVWQLTQFLLPGKGGSG